MTPMPPPGACSAPTKPVSRADTDGGDRTSDTARVLRQPWEVRIQEDGGVLLPLALLAEAGLDPGSAVFAYSDGDGRIVIRREDDALADLLRLGSLG